MSQTCTQPKSDYQQPCSNQQSVHDDNNADQIQNQKAQHFQKNKFRKINKVQNNESDQQSDWKVNQKESQSRQRCKWDKEELKLFKDLYARLGPNWTEISKTITKRAVSDLKNWFGNALRKAVKRIETHSQNFGQRVHRLNKNYFLSMLEIIYQTEKYINEMNLIVNTESNLLRFKSVLLKICFNPEDINDGQIEEFIKLSRILGLKLKCLGVFKIRNRKKWKLVPKTFASILLYDPVIIQNLEETSQKKSDQNFNIEDQWLSLKLPLNSNDVELKLIDINSDDKTYWLPHTGTLDCFDQIQDSQAQKNFLYLSG